MSRINNSKKKEKDALTKKIEKLFQNYGLDTTNMSDDEFERLKRFYKKNRKNIEQDLQTSEQYKDKFSDDIV